MSPPMGAAALGAPDSVSHDDLSRRSWQRMLIISALPSQDLACQFVKSRPPGRKATSTIPFQLPNPVDPSLSPLIPSTSNLSGPPSGPLAVPAAATVSNLRQVGTPSDASPASESAVVHSIEDVVNAAECRASQLVQSQSGTATLSPDPIDLSKCYIVFYSDLNPCIKLLDIRLHTVSSLRRTTLHNAVLAVSSKYCRPDLYPLLLAEAERQVGRGMAECKGGIELIQSICILVFWKAPSDGTGWLKIGFAIRLAFSLKLHERRTTPLPNDPHEAWTVLDRERTWFNLTCFERTCRNYLENDAEGVHVPNMCGDLVGFNLDQWLLDTTLYGCPEDRLLLLSVEMGNVKIVCDALRASRSPQAARSLVSHANRMLAEARTKFLPPLAPTGDGAYRAYLQQTMSWLWMNQRVQGGYLDCAGAKDPIALSAWIAATAEIVECSCQVVGSDLMAKMQDAPAVLLFRLAESFVKWFPLFDHQTQVTVMGWLITVYDACSGAKKGDETCVTAYIERFYRVVIRSLSVSTSVPPTRAPSPGFPPATDEHQQDQRQDQAERNVEQVPVYNNPFESVLGATGLEIVPELQQAGFDPLTFDPLAGMPAMDEGYWATLLPGLDNNGWAWLHDG
ncbi:fungal specific transcription factor domain-containing protein [Sporobolomyces koalae]|uniref:fungal specific transcription factor domain-containing protein n=1 Tax=Sporobolomyces koalae TaxID=500713 RepID=UPI0031746A92